MNFQRTFKWILEVFVEKYRVCFLVSTVASITLSFFSKNGLEFFWRRPWVFWERANNHPGLICIDGSLPTILKEVIHSDCSTKYWKVILRILVAFRYCHILDRPIAQTVIVELCKQRKYKKPIINHGLILAPNVLWNIVLQTFRCTSGLELDDWICVPHFQWFIPGRITAAILSFLVLTLSVL